MIVILLIIIASVLLFGREETQSAMKSILGVIAVLLLIGWIIQLFE